MTGTGEDGSTQDTVLRRRRRLALRAMAFVLVAGACGVGAAQLVTSPADRAAATAPPDPPVLTADVEERVLRATVVARATVQPAGTVQAAPGSAFQAEVTTLSRLLAAPGDRVAAGDVLVEVSGRPVVVLHGELPVYRSLRRGDEGKDVAQLQEALAELGHRSDADAEGRFGAATAAAVRAFYASIGYDAPSTGGTVLVPVGELLYVPEFPARVEAINGIVGGELETPTAVVSFGALTARAQARPADAELLERGQRVVLTSDVDGRERRGTVDAVDAVVVPESGPDGAGGAYVPVRVEPSRPLPASWSGRDVGVRITATSTEGRVLLVPVSAVMSRAGGGTVVTVVEGTSEPVDVEVDVGMSADGFVEISTDDRRVRAGAKVVVGDR